VLKKGNPVKVRNGPAAVTGDEICLKSLFFYLFLNLFDLSIVTNRAAYELELLSIEKGYEWEDAEE